MVLVLYTLNPSFKSGTASIFRSAIVEETFKLAFIRCFRGDLSLSAQPSIATFVVFNWKIIVAWLVRSALLFSTGQTCKH
jgi:hypothetical protein